jgi:hypothetical protein
MSNVTTQPIISSQQPVKIDRSLDYRRIYTNLFRYKITPNDISITFQSITDDPAFPAATLRVIEEAEITMSHNQTKSLVAHLSKLIAAFEREFGPIKTTGAPTDEVVEAMITAVKNLGFA